MSGQDLVTKVKTFPSNTPDSEISAFTSSVEVVQILVPQFSYLDYQKKRGADSTGAFLRQDFQYVIVYRAKPEDN